MSNKVKNVFIAFSGLIVYSALKIGFGFIFDDFVYIKLSSYLFVIVFGLLYLTAVIIYPKQYEPPSKKVVATALFTIGCFAVTSAITMLYFGNGLSTSVQTESETFIGTMVISGLVSFVVAPIAEEIIFRALMYKQLAEINSTFALIMSSLIFAVWHGTLAHMYTALIGGVILACVYQKTNKLVYSILCHSLFNISTALAAILIPCPTGTVGLVSVLLSNVISIIMIAALFATKGVILPKKINR